MTNWSHTMDERRGNLSPVLASIGSHPPPICGADDIVEKVLSVLLVVERPAPVLAQLQIIEHATLDVQRERGVKTLL